MPCIRRDSHTCFSKVTVRARCCASSGCSSSMHPSGISVPTFLQYVPNTPALLSGGRFHVITWSSLAPMPIMQFCVNAQDSTPSHVSQRFRVFVDVPLLPLGRFKTLTMEERGHCKVPSFAPQTLAHLLILCLSSAKLRSTDSVNPRAVLSRLRPRYRHLL